MNTPKPKGTLYLIPTPLGKGHPNHGLPDYTLQKIREINQFVVEQQGSALAFLQWIKHPIPDFKRVHRILNKKTPEHELPSLAKLLDDGDVGLFSETGAPAVADPGASLVRLAHDTGAPVVPLIGPSSILLALMASGMNGQSFCFHGYLPIDSGERKRRIHALESASAKARQTQLFIETPHRSLAMAEDLLQACQPSTRLCIAASLSSPAEWIRSKPVHSWNRLDLDAVAGKPCVFLIEA